MSVTVTDNFIPRTWAQSYPETWGSTTNDWKYGVHSYDLLATVTLALAEALTKSANHKTAEEDLAVTDQVSRDVIWGRTIEEAFSVMETYWDVIKFRVNVSESFTVTDDETNKIKKGVRVSLHLAEKVPKTIEKLFPITIFIEDDFFRKARTIRKVTETINLAEIAGKHPTLPVEETFEIVDFFYNTFSVNASETVSVADVLSRSFAANRVFAESVSLADALAKHTEISKEDFLSVRDTILQAANVVLNNIFVRHGAITSLKEFESLVNKAPGFTEFIDFKVGEYDYEEALVKLVVKSKMEQGKPSINNLTMHVDIPDTDARGTVVISSNELGSAKRVLFSECENKPFYYNPPEVNALVIGGYSNDDGILTPYITAITTTYFDVEIRNAGGSRVAGTVSWFAKGY